MQWDLEGKTAIKRRFGRIVNSHTTGQVVGLNGGELMA
jgi:hypothetical protein